MSLNDLQNSMNSVNNSSAINRIDELSKGLARDTHPRSKIEPTSGKNLSNTQALKPLYQQIHDLRPVFESLKFKYYDTEFKTLASDLYTFNNGVSDKVLLKTQTNNAVKAFNAIHLQMANILDVTKLNDYKLDTVEKFVASLDTGEYKSILTSYINDLKTSIVNDVEKIKKELAKNGNTKNSDIVPEPPDRQLDVWGHSISLKYIRPDNVTIDISSNIVSFVYSMDYDILNMPIFTIDIMVSDDHIRDFKNDFENLIFLMSVQKFERNKIKDAEYIRKVTVYDNHELLCLDPILPSDSPTDSDTGLSGIPKHRLRLDFVSRKSSELNVKFQSQVYNDCTVLDVINALMTDIYSMQKDNNVPEKELIKYTISPPDNTNTYEQIILSPGTLSQVLNELQETYGIYMTGIRIFFESLDTSTKDSKGLIQKNIITIKDKGGIVPAENSISDVLFEILDSRKTNLKQYDSGSVIDPEKKIFIIRTQEPYLIEKRNSNNYIEGESIRVINSSQNDVYGSACDLTNDKTRYERAFWSPNNNEYALSSLQDSLKEDQIIINAQVANLDVFSINDNYKFNIIFYNHDNKLYSGEYRLVSYRFVFQQDNLSVKDNAVFNAQFKFYTIPKIQVNGAEVNRDTYEDRLNRWRSEFSFTKNSSGSTARGGFPSISSYKPITDITPSFAGRTDYNGEVIPNKITSSYKLSKSGRVTLRDIYSLKDGDYPDRLEYFCQDYDIFCYAQKFANEIIDPLIDMFGKVIGGGGKFNSFYRYHVPSNGSTNSMHQWGLAVDGIWAAGTGDLLADSFNMIVNSSLDFDQVILEGNGSEWRWIHISLNMNSNNRRQALLSPTGSSNNLVKAKPGLASKSFYFQNVMTNRLGN